MFFTFWGLNALRRVDPPKRGQRRLDRMFGMMMPSRPRPSPALADEHGGDGPGDDEARHAGHDVQSVPELIAAARLSGARLVACTMSMDVMGIAESDLIDGIELGGVATFLGEAEKSGTTLFI